MEEPPRKKRKGETPKGKSKEKEPAKEKESTPNSPTPIVPLDFKTASLEVLNAVINSKDKKYRSFMIFFVCFFSMYYNQGFLSIFFLFFK